MKNKISALLLSNKFDALYILHSYEFIPNPFLIPFYYNINNVSKLLPER